MPGKKKQKVFSVKVKSKFNALSHQKNNKHLSPRLESIEITNDIFVNVRQS